MFIQRKKWFSRTVLSSVVAASCIFSSIVSSAENRSVNILNWEGQIGPTTVPQFTKETGIKVIYDTFDSNEVLEGKLMVGNSGFDVVSPSDSFLARQIKANLYLPLDKSKLPNLKNMDPKLMELLSRYDEGNQFAIPYVWMTTGIGYNVKKVKEVLGEDFPLDSWNMVFEPENMAKLAKCGVAFLDAPSEVFASAFRYLGMDPNTSDAKDYKGPAYELLSKVRPYIRYFHSSQYIGDLATGEICAVLGWSGDILIARNRAKEANNGVDIQYFVPKEGGILFFDTFAIPADSKHVDEAHEFLNFVMRPEIAAEVTNKVNFANANKASLPYLKPEIAQDPAIYPPEAILDKVFTLKVQNPRTERVMTRTWTKVRTGK